MNHTHSARRLLLTIDELASFKYFEPATEKGELLRNRSYNIINTKNMRTASIRPFGMLTSVHKADVKIDYAMIAAGLRASKSRAKQLHMLHVLQADCNISPVAATCCQQHNCKQTFLMSFICFFSMFFLVSH